MDTQSDYEAAIRDSISELEPTDQVKILVERCACQAQEIARQHRMLMRSSVEFPTEGKRARREISAVKCERESCDELV